MDQRIRTLQAADREEHPHRRGRCEVDAPDRRVHAIWRGVDPALVVFGDIERRHPRVDARC